MKKILIAFLFILNIVPAAFAAGAGVVDCSPVNVPATITNTFRDFEYGNCDPQMFDENKYKSIRGTAVTRNSDGTTAKLDSDVTIVIKFIPEDTTKERAQITRVTPDSFSFFIPRDENGSPMRGKIVFSSKPPKYQEKTFYHPYKEFPDDAGTYVYLEKESANKNTGAGSAQQQTQKPADTANKKPADTASKKSGGTSPTREKGGSGSSTARAAASGEKSAQTTQSFSATVVWLKDSGGTQPIPRVKITDMNGGSSTTTDGAGKFTINCLFTNVVNQEVVRANIDKTDLSDEKKARLKSKIPAKKSTSDCLLLFEKDGQEPYIQVVNTGDQGKKLPYSGYTVASSRTGGNSSGSSNGGNSAANGVAGGKLVSGTILYPDGTPAAGATIRPENQKVILSKGDNWAEADINGNFSLKNFPLDTRAVMEFVGAKTQIISANELKQNMTITIQQDETLDASTTRPCTAEELRALFAKSGNWRMVYVKDENGKMRESGSYCEITSCIDAYIHNKAENKCIPCDIPFAATGGIFTKDNQCYVNKCQSGFKPSSNQKECVVDCDDANLISKQLGVKSAKLRVQTKPNIKPSALTLWTFCYPTACNTPRYKLVGSGENAKCEDTEGTNCLSQIKTTYPNTAVEAKMENGVCVLKDCKEGFRVVKKNNNKYDCELESKECKTDLTINDFARPLLGTPHVQKDGTILCEPKCFENYKAVLKNNTYSCELSTKNCPDRIRLLDAKKAEVVDWILDDKDGVVGNVKNCKITECRDKTMVPNPEEKIPVTCVKKCDEKDKKALLDANPGARDTATNKAGECIISACHCKYNLKKETDGKNTCESWANPEPCPKSVNHAKKTYMACDGDEPYCYVDTCEYGYKANNTDKKNTKCDSMVGEPCEFGHGDDYTEPDGVFENKLGKMVCKPICKGTNLTPDWDSKLKMYSGCVSKKDLEGKRCPDAILKKKDTHATRGKILSFDNNGNATECEITDCERGWHTDANGTKCIADCPCGQEMDENTRECKPWTDKSCKKMPNHAETAERACKDRSGNETTTCPELSSCTEFCKITDCELGWNRDEAKNQCTKQTGTNCIESLDNQSHVSVAKWQLVDDKMVCVVEKCDDKRYSVASDKLSCVSGVGGECKHKDQYAKKASYHSVNGKLVCLIDECLNDTDFILTADKQECRQKTSPEALKKLEENAKEMRDHETSLISKTIDSVGIAGVGIGGMMVGSALSEQASDNEAEQVMRAYLETFRCEYGNGQNVKGGTVNVELPGGNDMVDLYVQYAKLANDLKLRKNALGLRPGIESEVVIDKASTGLYDDVGTGITGGTYASIARALLDPNGEDAKMWAAQKKETADKLKTGAIVAGASAVATLAANIAYNHDVVNKADDILNAEKLRQNNQINQILQSVESEVNSKIPCKNIDNDYIEQDDAIHPNCNCISSDYKYDPDARSCIKISVQPTPEQGKQCELEGDAVVDKGSPECYCPGNAELKDNNQCNCPSDYYFDADEKDCVKTGSEGPESEGAQKCEYGGTAVLKRGEPNCYCAQSAVFPSEYVCNCPEGTTLDENAGDCVSTVKPCQWVSGNAIINQGNPNCTCAKNAERDEKAKTCNCKSGEELNTSTGECEPKKIDSEGLVQNIANQQTISFETEALFDRGKSTITQDGKIKIETAFKEAILAAAYAAKHNDLDDTVKVAQELRNTLKTSNDFCVIVVGKASPEYRSDQTEAAKDRHNTELSKKRAEAVAAELKNIFNSKNIKSYGIGSKDCAETKESQYYKCRRVDVKLVQGTCDSVLSNVGDWVNQLASGREALSTLQGLFQTK